MTEFQEKQIRDLRLQGTGYRAIASVVGLSRDIVRNYCKSHGLDGYASLCKKYRPRATVHDARLPSGHRLQRGLE